MNPEIIKIAIENKAFLDALKLEIPSKKITTASECNKSLNSRGLWKITLLVGVVILSYNVYSYYNNKMRSTNNIKDLDLQKLAKQP
jgi:hypothetical protein